MEISGRGKVIRKHQSYSSTCLKEGTTKE